MILSKNNIPEKKFIEKILDIIILAIFFFILLESSATNFDQVESKIGAKLTFVVELR